MSEFSELEELRNARISCAECGHKLFMIVRINARTTMTCCFMCGHELKQDATT